MLSPPQLDRGMPLCSSAVSRCSSAFAIQFCFRGVGRFSKLLVYPSQFCFPAGLLEYPAICGGNLDGLEATRIIRQLSAEVPIIAQSAYAYEHDRNAAEEAGCNDFISKPIAQEKLKEKIKKWLK